MASNSILIKASDRTVLITDPEWGRHLTLEAMSSAASACLKGASGIAPTLTARSDACFCAQKT